MTRTRSQCVCIEEMSDSARRRVVEYYIADIVQVESFLDKLRKAALEPSFLLFSEDESSGSVAWCGRHRTCANPKMYFIDIVSRGGVADQQVFEFVRMGKELAEKFKAECVLLEFDCNLEASLNRDLCLGEWGFSPTLNETYYSLDLSEWSRGGSNSPSTDIASLANFLSERPLYDVIAFLRDFYPDIPHSYPLASMDCQFVEEYFFTKAVILEACPVVLRQGEIVALFLAERDDDYLKSASNTVTLVSPRFRGKGMAGIMCRWAAKKLGLIGYLQLNTLVADLNIAASRPYTLLGAVPTLCRKSYCYSA